MFTPLIIGAAWLADKGMTAYALYQDIAAVRNGSKTVEELALQKGDEYITAVFPGNAGKYGLKILKVGGKWISGKSDDLTNVMDSRASHGSGGKNSGSVALHTQQQRQVELENLFDKNHPKNEININDKPYRVFDTNASNTTKTIDTLSLDNHALQQSIFEYARQISGGRPLTATRKPGVWVTSFEDGTIVMSEAFRLLMSLGEQLSSKSLVILPAHPSSNTRSNLNDI